MIPRRRGQFARQHGGGQGIGVEEVQRRVAADDQRPEPPRTRTRQERRREREEYPARHPSEAAVVRAGNHSPHAFR